MGLADDITAAHVDLISISIDHKNLPRKASRDQLLRRSMSLEQEARRLRNRHLIALTLLQRAELLLAVDRPGEAISVAEQSKQVLGDLRKDDLRVRALGYLAEAHGRLEDWKAALEFCNEGIALVELYRYNLSADYLASAYLNARIGLYSWGVRSAYELKLYELAIECAELSKCRLILSRRSMRKRGHESSLEETAREAEFRDLCRRIAAYSLGGAPEDLLARRAVLWDWMNVGLSAAPPGKFSLARIRALLRPDEAILYYFWVDQNILLIAFIDRDGFAAELRSISEEQQMLLEAYAHNALTSEFIRPNYSAFEPVSGFGPLLLPESSSTTWHRKKRLLISPHRVLHSIPFHAIQYEGRWLIERAAISYIANLSSLELAYIPREDRRILIVGIENFNVRDVRGRTLGRLPDADAEATEIKQIYDDHRMPATLLLESEATAARLREMESAGTLKEYSCLHFATHGENVDSHSPMEARFYLQESFLDGLELANLQLGADTVVLSACCSGQRPISGRGLDQLPGDELFGLQAAFFRAGAHHIIGTLWPVDSPAARRISTGFHTRIAADRQCDPEIALKASICEYLSTANIMTEQIYFWAPFFLSSLGRAKKSQMEDLHL